MSEQGAAAGGGSSSTSSSSSFPTPSASFLAPPYLFARASPAAPPPVVPQLFARSPARKTAPESAVQFPKGFMAEKDKDTQKEQEDNRVNEQVRAVSSFYRFKEVTKEEEKEDPTSSSETEEEKEEKAQKDAKQTPAKQKKVVKCRFGAKCRTKNCRFRHDEVVVDKASPLQPSIDQQMLKDQQMEKVKQLEKESQDRIRKAKEQQAEAEEEDKEKKKKREEEKKEEQPPLAPSKLAPSKDSSKAKGKACKFGSKCRSKGCRFVHPAEKKAEDELALKLQQEAMIKQMNMEAEERIRKARELEQELEAEAAKKAQASPAKKQDQGRRKELIVLFTIAFNTFFFL